MPDARCTRGSCAMGRRMRTRAYRAAENIRHSRDAADVSSFVPIRWSDERSGIAVQYSAMHRAAFEWREATLRALPSCALGGFPAASPLPAEPGTVSASINYSSIGINRKRMSVLATVP